MVEETRRAQIRRLYRAWRVAIDKTQLEVEALAGIYTGRYWKIENGLCFPTESERVRLASVFQISEPDIPAESDSTEPISEVQRELLLERSAK